jgi:hypothetical protein
MRKYFSLHLCNPNYNKEIMKSAKDFFYEYYNANSGRLTIQSGIDFSNLRGLHPAFKDSCQITELKDFKPVYSNDFRMEKIFREVLDGCNSELRSQLNNVFIVSHFDLNFQAVINEYPGAYEGKIIFINLGLTSALIEYSILFAQFYEYILNTKAKKGKLKKNIIDSTKRIAESQKRWRKEGLYNLSSFNSTFYNLPTKIIHGHVAPFISVIKFILCHEIAHSTLGHLFDKENFGSEYFGVSFSDILQSPVNHQKEFNADIHSLLLSAGFYKHSNEIYPKDFQFKIEQTIGSLLTFTVFGQQTEDTSRSSDSHPSIENRFGIMINTLRRYMDKDLFLSIAGIVFSFQFLLYRTQRFGLGRYVPNDYNIFRL